jgi:hypothetical protein
MTYILLIIMGFLAGLSTGLLTVPGILRLYTEARNWNALKEDRMIAAAHADKAHIRALIAEGESRMAAALTSLVTVAPPPPPPPPPAPPLPPPPPTPVTVLSVVAGALVGAAA